MSKKVLDIEQMQHLKELGVDTSMASMCWIVDKENTHQPYIVLSPYAEYHVDVTTYSLPTFTLQDILDLLPKVTENEQQLRIIFFDDRNTIVEYDSMKYPVFFSCKDLIDSAYEMLCWCIENGHIKTAK